MKRYPTGDTRYRAIWDKLISMTGDNLWAFRKERQWASSSYYYRVSNYSSSGKAVKPDMDDMRALQKLYSEKLDREWAKIVTGFGYDPDSFPIISASKTVDNIRARDSLTGNGEYSERTYEQIEELARRESDDGNFWFGEFMVAENIIPLCLFVTGESALSFEDIRVEYNIKAKTLPAIVESLRTTYLPKYIQDCGKAGQKCHDDPSYSLDRYFVNRRAQDAGRKLIFELSLSPTSYYTFAMANLALDKLLLKNDMGTISLRKALSLNPESFDPDKLLDIPPFEVWNEHRRCHLGSSYCCPCKVCLSSYIAGSNP